MYGVSIIVPAFKALNRIHVLLGSLSRQTLNPACYEIVIILNGEDDGTVDYLHEWSEKHSEIQISWYHSSPQGVAYARNLGLGLSSYDYITFVDDDDAVMPYFLKTGLESSQRSVIGLVPIIDREPDQNEVQSSVLTKRIRMLQGQTVDLVDHPWVLSFNACKFVHRSLLSGALYDPTLPSGEDVAFFANLLRFPGVKVKVAGDTSDAEYIRVLRQNSISRRSMDFEFNIRERVQVIAALEKLRVTKDALGAKQALQEGQASFMRKFLIEFPNSIDQVRTEVNKKRLVNFPWSVINKNNAKDLVISYCFAPFSDTSAVVTAKRVRERGKIVDVIANDMSSVRRLDHSLLSIANSFIDSCTYVGSPTSFSAWESNCEFAAEVMKIVAQRKAENREYDTVYSRALWMGSHLAGAIYKIDNPAISWTAEFSDPLRVDSEGRDRPGKIVWNRYAKELKKVCELAGIEISKKTSPFHLIEATTLVLADELYFTNLNQQEYILGQYPSAVQKLAHAKSFVEPQPVPPPDIYQLVACELSIDSTKTNIGYFGNFYRNRGLSDIFYALGQLEDAQKNLIRLHVFSSDPDTVRITTDKYSCSEVVEVHDYLPYLDFLNSLIHMDVLLVNDADTAGYFIKNPFLPSKYSDYVGSGTKIWGLVENDSPLSQLKMHYRSELGDIDETMSIISALLQLKSSLSE